MRNYLLVIVFVFFTAFPTYAEKGRYTAIVELIDLISMHQTSLIGLMKIAIPKTGKVSVTVDPSGEVTSSELDSITFTEVSGLERIVKGTNFDSIMLDISKVDTGQPGVSAEVLVVEYEGLRTTFPFFFKLTGKHHQGFRLGTSIIVDSSAQPGVYNQVFEITMNFQ